MLSNDRLIKRMSLLLAISFYLFLGDGTGTRTLGPYGDLAACEAAAGRMLRASWAVARCAPITLPDNMSLGDALRATDEGIEVGAR